ncbi:MAG: HEAT repeat domain-containing protein [Pseudomonadota bacterium]
MSNSNGSQSNVLLTDEQMRHFIVNGFVSVMTDLPDDLHHDIYRKTNDIFGSSGDMLPSNDRNPLNNILPMVPQLQQVLDAPEVTGALTSLLGNNYVLHPHRHCHPNFPGEMSEDGQGLLMGIHKDGHAGGKRPRHRVPRWVIVFYFPQECPVEQGPTCVIPGNQYLRHFITEPMNTKDIVPKVRDDGTREMPETFLNRTFMPCAGKMGTVWFLHFDIEHSVLINVLEKARYGMKFVFMRTEEPETPAWNNEATYWQPPEINFVPHDQEIVHTYIWNWLSGKKDRFENDRVPELDDLNQAIGDIQNGNDAQRLKASNQLGLHRDAAAIPALSEALHDSYEPVRVNAAYALGAIGEPVIDTLITEMDAGQEAFEKETILHISEAAYALAAMGDAAVPYLRPLLRDQRDHMRGAAAFALGDMGPLASDAIQDLLPLLDETNILIQRHVISALGMIKNPTDVTVPALTKVLDGSIPEVGHIAAQALTRIGPDAGTAVSTLTNTLHTGGTYAQAWATEALARIGTPDALRGLTHFIQTARWFPYVHQKETFHSVDLSEKPVDLSKPEESLPNLLTEFLKAVGMGAPENIAVKRETEDNIYRLEIVGSGREVFVEATDDRVNFFNYRRSEEGVFAYR